MVIDKRLYAALYHGTTCLYATFREIYLWLMNIFNPIFVSIAIANTYCSSSLFGLAEK